VLSHAGDPAVLRQMVRGLLMDLDDQNCWTIAEAAGHCGLHRLQHLLSRAVWDDKQVLDIASVWVAGHLDDGDEVLIVDETADEKASDNAGGAARQYTGTADGIALCQVARTTVRPVFMPGPSAMTRRSAGPNSLQERGVSRLLREPLAGTTVQTLPGT
jgi:SRSO17 transposase